MIMECEYIFLYYACISPFLIQFAWWIIILQYDETGNEDSTILILYLACLATLDSLQIQILNLMIVLSAFCISWVTKLWSFQLFQLLIFPQIFFHYLYALWIFNEWIHKWWRASNGNNTFCKFTIMQILFMRFWFAFWFHSVISSIFSLWSAITIYSISSVIKCNNIFFLVVYVPFKISATKYPSNNDYHNRNAVEYSLL